MQEFMVEAEIGKCHEKKLLVVLLSLCPLQVAGEMQILAAVWCSGISVSLTAGLGMEEGCGKTHLPIPTSGVWCQATWSCHLVDAAYSQILLLSVLDLILEGLKESTLGRIVRGEVA